jgi:pimeloyl-ACP methyl ester carboxylesterase
MNAAFTAAVDAEAATAFATSFTAPGSALALDGFIADIFRTDGSSRAGLLASIGEGRFADEVAITATLPRPLAILHGDGEQLVSLDYLRTLTIPALWRDEIQLIPGAGHAPHQETPDVFASLLEQFIAGLG